MTDREFENILDDCLERLLVKGETIEECLATYSHQADVLRPLLQTAIATKKAVNIEPSPEFRAKARYQFRTAIQEVASKRSRHFSFWRFRWATVLTVILVMLVASGGLVAAASTSMPDNPLYPIKLAVEQLQLNLTFSDLGKANLYAKFADRRVAEIIHMAQKGNVSLADAATQRLDDQLAMIATFASGKEEDSRILEGAAQETITIPETKLQPLPPAPNLSLTVPATVTPSDEITDAAISDIYTADEEMSELAGLLQQNADDNTAALRNLLDTASEAVKPVLLQAIAVSEAGYENALNAIIE